MSDYSNAQSSLLELVKLSPLTFNRSLTLEEFTLLAERFPNVQMERARNGKVTLMSPVKKGSGSREGVVSGFVIMWALTNDIGEAYSPSVGILLPSGEVRSPDASWVSDERLSQLQEDADEDFLKAVPDFIAEVRSSTDSLKKLKTKMKDTWMANGVRLGWLIDPYSEKVWIYRNQETPEELKGFKDRILSGEEIMPGLELPLSKIRKGVRKKKRNKK